MTDLRRRNSAVQSPGARPASFWPSTKAKARPAWRGPATSPAVRSYVSVTPHSTPMLAGGLGCSDAAGLGKIALSGHWAQSEELQVRAQLSLKGRWPSFTGLPNDGKSVHDHSFPSVEQ